MIFYVNKKQKIFLRKDRRNRLIKKFLRFLLFLFIFLCFLSFWIYRYKILKFFLIDKNLFFLEDVKINIIDINNAVFVKNGDFIKGIPLIDNLFLLEKDKIESYIYKNFENVKIVRVKKYYPHRLIIDIYPKKPFFLLHENKNFALDENGFVFQKDNFSFNLISLYDLEVNFKKDELKKLNFSERVKLLEKFIKEIREKNYNFYKFVSCIDINSDEKISFFFKNKYIVFGNIEENIDILKKIKYLELAIENFDKRNVEQNKNKNVFVDVSNFFVYMNKKQEIYGKMIFSYKDF